MGLLQQLPRKEQKVRNCAFCSKRIDIDNIKIKYCSVKCRTNSNNAKKRAHLQGTECDYDWQAIGDEAHNTEETPRLERQKKNIEILDSLNVDLRLGLNYSAFKLKDLGFNYYAYDARFLIYNTTNSFLLQFGDYKIVHVGYEVLLIMK